MRRAELRDWLRSMPQGERDSFIRENSLEPEMAFAFLEMPAVVSGISPAQREAMLDRALEAQHPGAIEEIQALEAAISLAEKAVNLGREEIIKEAGADCE